MELNKMKQPQTAEEARQQAIDWQVYASKLKPNGLGLSYGEFIEWANYFEAVAKKFNLTEEFKENGII